MIIQFKIIITNDYHLKCSYINEHNEQIFINLLSQENYNLIVLIRQKKNISILKNCNFPMK